MAGRKLMAERDLAAKLGISRSRLRILLSRLESEGLIHRRQGSGTYAAEAGEGAISDVLLLVDRRLKLGDDPFFSAVMEQVQHALQAEGIRCSIRRASTEDRPGDLISAADGGLITIGLSGRGVLEQMKPGGPPAVGLFVSQARVARGVRASLVDLDDVTAGRQATQLLAETGCGRVVFVGHNALPVSEKRLSGARAAAAELGISFEAIDAGMNYMAGLEAGRRLQLPEGAGVVAANDWVAVGIRAGLSSRRGQPKRQPAICSFDGLPIAEDPSLGIRSFRAPLEEIAADAVSELRRLAASPAAAGRTITYRLLEPPPAATEGRRSR